MTITHNLFEPIQVGSSQLQNRVVMAPLTRTRAEKNIPTDLAVEYYKQRASSSGTLLISEASYIHPSSGGGGFGAETVPGIWNDSSVIAGWKKVIDAIHSQGSKIFIQLWDLGRVADHAILAKDGYELVGPSAIAQAGDEEGAKHVRALTIPEIKQKVQRYVDAAKAALEAGADGVEIHSANGYLPDQFIHWNSNHRTDEYGGSIENRARFTLEIIDAVVAEIGADKVGVRFSPWTTFQDMAVCENQTVPQFTYLFEQLESRAVENPANRLAYIHVIEPRANGIFDATPEPWQSNETFRAIWTGNLIRAGGFDRELAIETAQKDNTTLVAFGRRFIANPDLVYRLKNDLPLNKWDRDTFYVPGPKGYIDYPFYKE